MAARIRRPGCCAAACATRANCAPPATCWWTWLPLLQRTGFSTVQLRADQRVDSARRALRFFSGHYQGDLVEPQPLFNREAA